MATTPSLKVVKTFPYRGTTKTWSNRYHFNGGVPSDTAHWTTFSDAVVTAEKAILCSAPTTTIVATYGYLAGSDVPVFSKTYSTAGTFLPSASWMAPGDCAAVIRYSTTARTSKNHPIYLYSYYHGVATDGQTTPDVLKASQLTAMQTYAAAWVAGFSDGTLTLKRAGPNGATGVGYLVLPQIRHRDFS